jgi:hypothetical protein
MKAFAGLLVLAFVLVGSMLISKTPGATPRSYTVEQTESGPDAIPPYLHVDPYDWR